MKKKSKILRQSIQDSKHNYDIDGVSMSKGNVIVGSGKNRRVVKSKESQILRNNKGRHIGS